MPGGRGRDAGVLARVHPGNAAGSELRGGLVYDRLGLDIGARERDDGLGGMELDQGSVGGMRRGSRAAAAGCGGGSVLSFGARVTAGGDRV